MVLLVSRMLNHKELLDLIKIHWKVWTTTIEEFHLSGGRARPQLKDLEAGRVSSQKEIQADRDFRPPDLWELEVDTTYFITGMAINSN